MKNKTVGLFGVLVSVFVLLLNSPTAAAQTGSIPLRLVVVNEQGIAFYEVTDSQPPQPIGEPLADFAIEEFGGTAEWTILNTQSFAVSPDGQHIAFTAQASTEAAVFIYAVNEATLIQQPIPSYWLVPTWSPDGEAVLLTVGYGQYGGGEPVPSDYVYEITTGSLFQITFTPYYIERVFQWSPDGQYVVYFGGCEPDSCGNVTNDLYYVERDSSERFPITDLTDLYAVDRFLAVCDPAWSSANQRWYYEIGCGGGQDTPHEFVYSTNLAGDNRLDIDLEAYLAGTDLDSVLIYNNVMGIHPRPEGVYAAVDTCFYPAGLEYASRQWRVLRQNEGGQIETPYIQPTSSIVAQSGDALTASVISPDGQRMVLLYDFESGYVVDLTSNQNVRALPSDGAVCDVRWLDNETVVYNVGDRFCERDARQARQLNVVTGAATVLTEGFSGAAWVLPIPEAEVLADLPLTANAGPDQAVDDADGSGFEAITLDGSGSLDNGMIVSYVWTESDVEIATGVSPQVELAVGAHTITLTVTDDDGLTDTDEVVITVAAN